MLCTLMAAACVILPPPVSSDVELNGLHGTLLEARDRTGAAAVLLAGSGPTDRDGNQLPAIRAATLRLLAEGLAEHGVATVRADKRGIGASAAAGLNEADLRFDHYVDDARAWAADLAARSGLSCVWMIGHSEGGLVAQAAAADNDGVCGVVLLTAAGRPAGVVLREQLSAQPLPPGYPEQIEQALSELEAGRTVDNIPGLEALFRPSVQPYLISWFALDPAALIAAYDRPVMIVHAAHDLQVVAADADALAAAQPNAIRLDLDSANHVLKDAPAERAGNLAAYANPDLPLSPGLVEAVARFMLEQ